MGDKKRHFVFSARTTEEGLRILNELKDKLDMGWDEFVIDAMCTKYDLDRGALALPRTGPTAEEKAAAKAAKEADKKAKADAKAKAKADKKAKAEKAKADKKAKAKKAKAEAAEPKAVTAVVEAAEVEAETEGE